MPTGELPRNMSVLVDRLLVGKISPGTRVTVVGIYSVCGSKDSGGPKRKDTSGAVAIRQPYLRVVGIEGDLDEDARQTRAFTCGHVEPPTPAEPCSYMRDCGVARSVGGRCAIDPSQPGGSFNDT